MELTARRTVRSRPQPATTCCTTLKQLARSWHRCRKQSRVGEIKLSNNKNNVIQLGQLSCVTKRRVVIAYMLKFESYKHSQSSSKTHLTFL